MGLQKRTIYSFVILLFLHEFCYSQNILDKFKDKIDFDLLSEVIKMSTNDTIFVSSLKNKGNNDYFYNSKTKTKIIPEGYEVAYPFIGKTAIVKYNNRWGLIDRAGKFIYFPNNPNTIRLSSYEKYGIFSNNDSEKAIYNLENGFLQQGYTTCAEPVIPDYFIKKTDSNKYRLIKAETNESVFKTDMDSIISKNRLIYKENDDINLILVQKKNNYGLFLSNGNELLKLKYKKAKFLGEYIMVYENNIWNYYTYKNNELHLAISTKIECISSAYQNNIIGVFKKNNKYNLLKINGEILPSSFDYINDDGTFGVNGNSVVVFNSIANYYHYYRQHIY
ncbi:hypothetical protein H5J24_18155 [Chryseobacterium capnotolerans]|uniref:hypothetical protein n=1 Tax=Chryseobacterium TaxID=59732 RepID=UPI000AC01060|nr:MULTISPECIES: hypothetical protein [Chryseobacterium]UHO37581.1 hypothetical protein H5J24_18155 [Chryseobacterium capnotolerans]